MSADDSLDSPPPSKVPSWILLGFILGALFVLLFKLKPGRHAAQPPAAAVASPTPAVQAAPPAQRAAETSFEAVEAIWAAYGHHAVWDGDLTEISLWNSEARAFSDCYEVLRHDDQVYFRRIPKLTRPVADRGLGPSAPVLFTVPSPARPRR